MTTKRIQMYGRSDPMATHLLLPAVPADPIRLTLCGWEDYLVATVPVELFDRFTLTGSMETAGLKWGQIPTCTECWDKLCKHCGCSYLGHVDGKCLFMETNYAPHTSCLQR